MQRTTLIILVALSVAFGATAVAAADHASVDVTQEPGEQATVTVTDGENETVSNASVVVELADEEADYGGTGNYTTDENGMVTLDAPEDTVDVVVTATIENETVSTEATLETLPDLEVAVDQETGENATVTVSVDGEPVENASVDVETVDENASYAGTNETYETDENGTVTLTAPEETVDVTVTATDADTDRSTTVDATLEAAPELAVTVEQDRGHPATVTVSEDGEPAETVTVSVETDDENASYAGTGEHTTDENGTVTLPVPEETVDVTVSVAYDGASTATTATLESAPDLAVNVTQDRGHDATVSVSANGEDAENATVTVAVTDENATYAGANETYETDENGTATLPAPEETVEVTVTAALDNATASTNVTLEAAPDLDVSVSQEGPGLPATVTVDADGEPAAGADVSVELVDAENASYAGTGEYTTDENGTVELVAPEESVDVELTVQYEGAEETLVTTLEATDAIDDSQPFGQQLQQFKATLDGSEHTGQAIASWVVANNPGNAPDHAGPNSDDGDEASNASNDDRGPPAHAGGPNGAPGHDDGADGADEDDGAGGPPTHANSPHADDADDADDDDEEDEEDEADDAESSGNGNGNGHGNGNGNGHGN